MLRFRKGTSRGTQTPAKDLQLKTDPSLPGSEVPANLKYGSIYKMDFYKLGASF
jgi:hypothetical protein